MEQKIESIRKFVFAGNATFTVKNNATGNRFTFRVSAPKTASGGKDMSKRFVSVLSGPNNESNYSYMGMITDRTLFRRTKASKVGEDALSFKAFTWLMEKIRANVGLPEGVEFLHEGRCARCGRKLTTPESIEAGFGPECVKFC